MQSSKLAIIGDTIIAGSKPNFLTISGMLPPIILDKNTITSNVTTTTIDV